MTRDDDPIPKCKGWAETVDKAHDKVIEIAKQSERDQDEYLAYFKIKDMVRSPECKGYLVDCEFAYSCDEEPFHDYYYILPVQNNIGGD